MSDQTPFTDLGDTLLYSLHLAEIILDPIADQVDTDTAEDIIGLLNSLKKAAGAAFTANNRDVGKYSDGSLVFTTTPMQNGYGVCLHAPGTKVSPL